MNLIYGLCIMRWKEKRANTLSIGLNVGTADNILESSAVLVHKRLGTAERVGVNQDEILTVRTQVVEKVRWVES